MGELFVAFVTSERTRTPRISGQALIERLDPRLLLAAVLPSKILFQDGYSDTLNGDFGAAQMQNFTVIGGNTSSATLVNSLRAQGKLFLYNVSYVSGFSAEQLVDLWSQPFKNTLGG